MTPLHTKHGAMWSTFCWPLMERSWPYRTKCIRVSVILCMDLSLIKFHLPEMSRNSNISELQQPSNYNCKYCNFLWQLQFIIIIPNYCLSEWSKNMHRLSRKTNRQKNLRYAFKADEHLCDVKIHFQSILIKAVWGHIRMRSSSKCGRLQSNQIFCFEITMTKCARKNLDFFQN